jgi:hypothetical protein
MTPPRMKQIPTIFSAVKVSLKIKNDARKMPTYTSAVETGMM